MKFLDYFWKNALPQPKLWILLAALLAVSLSSWSGFVSAQEAPNQEQLGLLLLPEEPLSGQASTSLGKLESLSWSAFSFSEAAADADKTLQPVLVTELRAAGGWAQWLEQARADAQKRLQSQKPELLRSQQGLLEAVSYESPHAASLLLAHESLFQRWQEQLGQEMLILLDGQERLWLVAALSPNRPQLLSQWQVTNGLSGQFFLLGEEGLRPGGQLRLPAAADEAPKQNP